MRRHGAGSHGQRRQLMIDWTDRLDQIHSVRPDSKRIHERLELLLRPLVFDPEESRVDSAEEHDDACS